jgi:hypothetical protein
MVPSFVGPSGPRDRLPGMSRAFLSIDDLELKELLELLDLA